jgi:hypothetical protein
MKLMVKMATAAATFLWILALATTAQASFVGPIYSRGLKARGLTPANKLYRVHGPGRFGNTPWRLQAFQRCHQTKDLLAAQTSKQWPQCQIDKGTATVALTGMIMLHTTLATSAQPAMAEMTSASAAGTLGDQRLETLLRTGKTIDRSLKKELVDLEGWSKDVAELPKDVTDAASIELASLAKQFQSTSSDLASISKEIAGPTTNKRDFLEDYLMLTLPLQITSLLTFELYRMLEKGWAAMEGYERLLVILYLLMLVYVGRVLLDMMFF